MKTADLCRKHGISEASFYNWKAKYGGLEVSEAKLLRGLESENARLKKLLADEASGAPFGLAAQPLIQQTFHYFPAQRPLASLVLWQWRAWPGAPRSPVCLFRLRCSGC